jgi:hypothetical protein
MWLTIPTIGGSAGVRGTDGTAHARAQLQGGCEPSWHTTVVLLLGGTTTVVLAGGGGLELLMHAQRSGSEQSAASNSFIV